MSKITNEAGYFIAVAIWQHWASKG